MEFFPNYPVGGDLQPGEWARRMETQGWHGVCASDHLWVSSGYPHVFVAATQMACATSRVRITTSFCNNLFRSPVEFAQAALSLQAASEGRFEAGLGAGWLEDEITAMGLDYPDGPERVSRYVEALKITRQLLRTGQCQFSGEYYRVDIAGSRMLAGVSSTPPPLVASAGGPRALREVTPLVDRVEIKASARATRVGHLDFTIMASVTEAEVLDKAARVRAVSESVPMGVFLLVGCGPQAQTMKAGLADGYLGRFFGEAQKVAANLLALQAAGIDRVQLTEAVPGSIEQLAGELL